MTKAGANSAIRGRVARMMVAQDSRWATDVVLSSESTPAVASSVGLLLSPHFVRIAYEGALTLRSEEPNVGVPELASILRDQFESITARVRHTTKLLDDTKKTFDAVIDEFDGIVVEHRSQFMGNALPIVRSLETDLGLYFMNERPIGATVPTAYRLGIKTTARGEIAGVDVMVVSQEWGATLAVLNAAALDASEQGATLDFTGIPRITNRDRRSDRYLAGRFERDFPIGLKMLLLAVECDVNTLVTVVPYTSEGHEESVFRLRVITLFHVLSTLRHVRARYADLRSTGIRDLTRLLDDEAVRWLLSKEGKAVRNRCMHYPILDDRVSVDLERPMFGIVEAVGSRSLADVDDDANDILQQLSELLGGWR